jgi:hypothetical protein
MNGQEAPLFCARCLKPLIAGRGEFYVVLIDAVADPTPPHFTPQDLHRDIRAEIVRLLKELQNCSEHELMDQVLRRTIIHLCNPCFASWIEDPAG